MMENLEKMKLLIQLLKNKEIQFENGLTNNELIKVENEFGFKFPPDLQTLLCTELPISEGFVDWRKALTSREYKKYPKLIPVFLHRYIPSTPQETGNPVFSVYQMDIIYYGTDLATYFRNAFKLKLPDDLEFPKEVKHIRFWSEQTPVNYYHSASDGFAGL